MTDSSGSRPWRLTTSTSWQLTADFRSITATLDDTGESERLLEAQRVLAALRTVVDAAAGLSRWSHEPTVLAASGDGWSVTVVLHGVFPPVLQEEVRHQLQRFGALAVPARRRVADEEPGTCR